MNSLKLSCLIIAYLLVIFFIAAVVPGTGGQLPGSDDSFRAGESDACSRNGDLHRIGGPLAAGTSAAGLPVEAEAEAEGEVKEKGEGSKVSSPPTPGGAIPTVYPLPASSIYTYEQMTSRLRSLNKTYPDLIKLGSVGSSVEGRNLWSLFMGKGEKRILVLGGCHAREWLTSALLVKTIETYAEAYGVSGTVDGFPVREVLDQYTLLFVPMQNPDGITLAQHGLAAFPEEKHAQLLSMKPGKSDNFTRWKANICGVDLNRQHSAGSDGWTRFKYNVKSTPRKPWFEEYPGGSPESEPESRAIGNLIRQGRFEAVLNYHSSGNMLFWYYFQNDFNKERDLKIVRAMSARSGYRIYSTEYVTRNFAAHLTAWVVHDLKIPCITVEIGKYTTGYLNMGDLNAIWPKTRALPLVAAQNLPGYPTLFEINCRVIPEQGGEITGGGNYQSGTEVKVSAAPKAHYVFVNWTEKEDILGTDPDIVVLVTANRILTANFKLIEYTVTASAGDGGSVEGGGRYTYGSEVTLKAKPDEGYMFTGWTDNGLPVCDMAMYTFRVEGNRNLTACFEMTSE